MNEWMEHPDLANLDPLKTGADPDSGDESRWQERESAGPGDDVADHRRE